MTNNFQNLVLEEGLAIFNALNLDNESIFNKEYWFGIVMDYVMKDPSFKVDMFQFIDVLPVLTTDDQIAKHIKEYLLKKDRDLPAIISTALKAASLTITKGIAASTIRKNVTDIAQRFIAGRDINDAQKKLYEFEKQGFCFTIDLLGEKTLSNAEADLYMARYQHLIETLPQIVNPKNGDVPNVSLKVSALSCYLVTEDPLTSIVELKKRILPLLRIAKANNVFINFDVESYASHEIIYKLFSELALSEEFRSWPLLGIVVQAYLLQSRQHTNDLIDLCRKRRCPITIRLVKGAYWDYELVKAQKLGHHAPVFVDKARTDCNYEELSRLLLDNITFLRPAFGSHNIRSLAHAIAYANQKNIGHHQYEIQMLYGMAAAERKALLMRGHTVRIYVPIGEMLVGMSYLVRRLLENTSQMSFVKMSNHDQKDQRDLLKEPVASEIPPLEKVHEFINASLTDFSDKTMRDNFSNALHRVRKNFPVTVRINIDKKDISSKKTYQHLCPSDVSLTIFTTALASCDDAERAILASVNAQPALQQSSLIKRCEHLLNLAAILENDRFDIAATMCFEVGKTWAEADADVAEAIDFCRYYAQRAHIEISPRIIGNIDGEHNVLSFHGRGPTVIIAPWNFPLAILCGMSVAAYVCGNPIIMKPAETSTLMARMLYERMIKAAFISEAVQFLPGSGKEIGPYLVAHPHVATICFTGSLEVGHEIMLRANTVVPEQIQMKRVICEMGGKNAIIVDEDADLDEAVMGIIASAFGYAGQKCSAASRVIAVGSVKEQLIDRLIMATISLRQASSLAPNTFLGPVIDQKAYDRLMRVIDDLATDPSVNIIERGVHVTGGYFVPATLVFVKDMNHWIMQQELFGPIVAVYHAANLAEACRVANHTKFGLTGGFFSRSPVNIAYVRENFSVGNLYINQKCTGALVHRQPFGGFKMSGTGIKAGGPHYLLNFVDTKVVSENTMRQGFTPEVSI